LREIRVKTEQSIKLIEVRRFFPVYYRKATQVKKAMSVSAQKKEQLVFSFLTAPVK
jgi:hypothetical protein